jgi:hypothetical protein
MLFGPTVPSACAQAESLADWSTKAQAKAFTEPLKANKTVRFNNLAAVLHQKGQWVDAANDPQEFNDLYEKRLFPLITHLDVRGTKDDPVLVLHNHFKQLDADPTSPAFNALAVVTLDYMSKIASDPQWHPAVRENALLAIGEVRTPQTVDVLMKMVKSKDLPSMLKVAAMADLVHLAQPDPTRPSAPMPLATPAVSGPVVALMAKAAVVKIPNDGWRWMRGQAADILGAVGSVGASDEVPAALLSILADEELPLIIRGKAARALGKLQYTGNLPDATAYTKAFAQFGSAALADNLPGESRRIWAVCIDFLGGIDPLMKQGTPSKTAQSIKDAMDELKTAASKQKSSGTYPTEEDLKQAVAKARKVLDAAAKK